MGRIRDLPSLERPREKAFHYGIDKLADHELIALLIGSGTTDSSAIDIAYEMIKESRGLYSLVQKPFSDLLNYKGIGRGKAVKIIAAFEIAKRFNSLAPFEESAEINTEYIYQKYRNLIGNSPQEKMYLVILNKKKKIVHEVNLYKGNETSINCSISQIIQQVIIHNGNFFFLVHNHPSGHLMPSNDDISFTSEVIRESKKFRITMLDHLIISQQSYFSFLQAEPLLKDD